MKLQIEFVALANVNNDITAQLTRNRIYAFFTYPGKGQRRAFELISALRSRNTFDYNIGGLAFKITVIRAEIVERLAKTLIIVTEICRRSLFLGVLVALVLILLSASRKKQNKSQ